MMLKVNDINVFYGNIQALKGVSLEVNEGEIVTLIGANGAGKSTLLKTLSGLLKPKQGEIEYLGKSIAGKAAQSIVKAGISQVPEGRRVFANMTVEENLELGAYLRNDRAEIAKDKERIFKIFPILLERRKQLSGTLSGGEQQMLAMGSLSCRGRGRLPGGVPSGERGRVRAGDLHVHGRQHHRHRVGYPHRRAEGRLALRLRHRPVRPGGL